METTTHHLPLRGVRVIDFTTILAGPHLTQWLAVLGAEVIKIETHLRAESRLVSVLAKTPRHMGLNESDSFAIHNYSKKSVTLNMKHPKAASFAKRLIAKSDIVAENFAGDVMGKWGLGYDELIKLKSDIIYYAGSGYGRSGPRMGAPLYAPVADAQNGLVATNGYPGGEPYTLGSSGWSDMAMAMHGAFAVLVAWRHRQMSGEGQFIDAAMVEIEAQFLGDMYLDHLMNARLPQPQGNGDTFMAPHGVYRCKGDDKWVAIAVGSQAEWEQLKAAMGYPEWTSRDEFADELRRWDHQDELDTLLAAWTSTQDRDSVATRLQDAGIAATASLDLAELVEDRHINERGFFKRMTHPVMGDLHVAGLPTGHAEGGHYQPAPLLGQHNQSVFGDLLGLSAEEIAQLEGDKVLY